MSVLGVLLEGFDEARHPRGFHGRFKAGDHVTLMHGMFGSVPARVTKVTAGRVHVTSSDSRVSDTSMTHNQAAVKLTPVSSSSRERGAAEVDAHMAAFKRGEVSRPRVRGDGRSGPIAPSSPSAERQRQVAARTGQGAGPAVFSSGRPITAPQRKRLSSVVNDIHANAWQDRSYMNALISGALRDSGHTMGMTPGWMDRLHTNHASQLIKDLERLARHGPGEMAREAQPLVLGALLDRDFSAERRRKLASSGAAMKDGSFPIENASDLSNAVQAVGRASSPDAAKSHIRKRARALGLTSRLPDGW